MDRSALARELFDLHQEMRQQVQVLLLAADDDTRQAGRKILDLVERGDAIISGYCASSESGPARVHVRG